MYEAIYKLSLKYSKFIKNASFIKDKEILINFIKVENKLDFIKELVNYGLEEFIYIPLTTKNKPFKRRVVIEFRESSQICDDNKTTA